jgi:hypothetical protein
MSGYSVPPTLRLQYFMMLKGTRGADIQRLIVMPVSALASAQLCQVIIALRITSNTSHACDLLGFAVACRW